MPRTINIREVARRAGVSPSTVSRVLNGTQRVDPRLAERVLAVIDELGYLPNSMKRHERTIALVVPAGFTARANWSASTLDGVIDGSTPHHVTIMRQDHIPAMNPAQGKRYWRRFAMQMGVRGVIVVHGARSSNICKDLQAAEVPALIFGRGEEKDHWVWCDNVDIVKDALKHAYELGHRRIGFLGPKSHQPDHIDRMKAYREFIAEHGLTRDEAFFEEGESSTAGQRIDQMLGKAHRPTALFIGDAQAGVSVLNRMRHLDLSVPDDLSMITMGHSQTLEDWHPRLTMVVRRLHQGAQLAAKTLLEIVQAPPSQPVHIVVPSDLIIGESVAPIR